MVKLALETPYWLMNLQSLADFDFILAHKVLQDKNYAGWYKRSGRYKILDNSTNEKYEPMPWDKLIEAANIVGAGTIVAPDWLGDAEKTYSECQRLSKSTTCLLLPVLQGSSVTECIEYSKKYRKLGFTNIAIPYDICHSKGDYLQDMADSRFSVVKSLVDFKVHLLGMNTVEELTRYNSSHSIVSIDTGSPILNGLDFRRFGKDILLPKGTPTLNWIESTYREELKEDPLRDKRVGTVYYNIAFLRRLLNGIGS